MTASPPRTRLVLAALVFAGAVGPVGASTVGASTAIAPAQQQSVATELDLQATLTGDLVVVAGWFELTGTAEGRLDTGAGASTLGATYDVNLVERVGEFAYSGEVVGTVNASRVLFAFGGNASGFGRGESVAPPAGSSGDGAVGSVGSDRDPRLAAASTVPAPESGDPDVEVPAVGGPLERATRADVPLQIRPFRRPGVSVFDLYWQFATLVLGLVVIGLFPRFSRRVAGLGAGEPLRTGGAGLAVVLVVPVALLILGLSLFGIPLAVAGVGLYLVLWWVGAVYGRFTVGLWVLGAVARVLAAVDVDVRRIENRWAGLLVGTVLVGGLVVLPVVGPVVESVVLLLGLGGVSRLAYGSYRRTERGERNRNHAADAVAGPDE